jgi:hypothetical protein
MDHLYCYIKTRFENELSRNHEILPIHCIAHVMQHMAVLILNFACDLLAKLRCIVRQTHMFSMKQGEQNKFIQFANLG